MRNKDIESWSRIETVGELIEELKKYPPEAKVKTYPERWNLRSDKGGDLMFSRHICGLETCRDDETVGIVHN